MITEATRSKIAELRAMIAATASTATGTARGTRSAAVELKRRAGDEGMTAPALARALGVHVRTLYRWEWEVRGEGRGGRKRSLRQSAPEGFRAVQVVGSLALSSEGPSAPVKVAHASLRVAHAGSGLIIEGLDVESLATLMRRLS